MQGRVPAGVEQGYRCNLTVIGHSGSTGGFRVHRYVDRDGRECAYYDTTLLFPTNALSLSGEPTGVAVLDMTDPAKPVRTATLVTPAMQTPHESLNISGERGLLAAVMGNPAFAPGVVDVYDISRDCRHPELMASAPASVFGHESGAGGCVERPGFGAVSARPRGPGVYVVRFTTAGDRRVIVLKAGDRVHVLRAHHRRVPGCGLLRRLSLTRPVFDGRLTGSYRLNAPARATLTVTRGRKVVRRFASVERPAGTHRFSLRGRRRGAYAVRLVARSGEDQVSATVSARRL